MNELKNGMIFKNYKELCDFLNENPKTGESKRSQMKDWQRFFNYEKEGNKLIITEVFDEPKEKEDKRRNGNRSIYVQFIEILLMHFLKSKKEFTYSKPKREWWRILGMVNDKYKYGNQKEREELMKLDKSLTNYNINIFYRNTTKKLTDIFQSALSSLRRKRLIDYVEELTILDDKGYHLATDEEAKEIQDIERKVLCGMGFKSINQVFFKFRQEEYFKKVYEKAYEKFGIKSYFKSIKVIFVSENIKKALPDEEEEFKKSLNNLVMEAIDRQAHDAYFKAYKKYCDGFSSFCPPSDFLYSQNYLKNELINLDKLEGLGEAIDFFDDDDLNMFF